MTAPALAEDIAAISPLTDGMVKHKFYASPEVFDLELKNLFARTWIYLGHECQILEPGDYFLGHIGLASIIVNRAPDGQIHAHQNRCAHRGAPVCLAQRGNTKTFKCPYHGWTYNPDGSLKSMPMADEYGADFPKSERGLPPVPRVSIYRGFIFGSLAETGPDLETFLGEAKIALDDFMDRAPEGRLEMVDEEPVRHRFRGNWKFQFENLNDFLHPITAHASALRTAEEAANEAGRAADGNLSMLSDLLKTVGKISGLGSVMTEYGHSFIPGFAKTSGVNASVDSKLEDVLAQKHGAERAKEIVDVDNWVLLIYPSLIIKPGTQNLRIIRPIAHDETELTMQIFKMPGAPEEVLYEAYEYQRNLGSPAASILADDLVIYEILQADYGRDYAISAERGLGAQSTREDGEPYVPGTSEEYIRRQFDVWKRYVTGAAL
jgi:phenylpropionate dioxygenase-like ring-hydroxylating dioxygenase large terminal subunit